MDVDSKVEQLADKYAMTVGAVNGIITDLANQKQSKESQDAIAQRWGVPFGRISAIRQLAKVEIADIREGAVTKSLIIADRAKDLLADKLEDPNEIKKMTPRDLSTIAKQQEDCALNMSNGTVGAPTNQINIGEIKILRELRSGLGEYTPIRERIKTSKKAVEVEVETQEPT